MSHNQNNGSRRLDQAPDEGYAPRDLAARHGISTQQARDLLAEVGHDGERLDAVARAVRMAKEG